MADHFYGINVGGGVTGSVTTGTVTTAKNIELRITDGVSGNSKTEVLKAIEALEYFIATSNAPA